MRSFIEIFQREENNCSVLIDEAHFHLNGFVNKQNFKYWGMENPRTHNCVVHSYARPHYWPHTSLKTQKAFQRRSMEKDIDICSIHS